MVTTWQAIVFGVALAYTPAAVFNRFILWRDSKSSDESSAKSLRRTANRIAGCRVKSGASPDRRSLATHNEILVLLMAGFNVELLRKAVPIGDSET